MRTLALILTTGLVAAPAAGAVTIQPGMQADLRPGGGSCTMNFVFDGLGKDRGRVFIGTAAHCSVHDGDAALRDEVYAGEEPIGRVAMVGNAEDHADDYMLVEILTSLHGSVVPEVRGHPGMPTGFTTGASVAADDQVLFSGYGLAFGQTQPTREEREGQLVKADDGYYQVFGPLMQGDSGGPVLHGPSGRALGTVSGNCSDVGCLGDGPTVQGILARVRARGMELQLRLAGAGAPVATAAPPADPPRAAEPSSAPPPPPVAAAALRISARITCVRRGRARLTVRGSEPLERVTVRGRTFTRSAIRLTRLPRRGTLAVTATAGGRSAGARVRLRPCR